MSQSNPEQIERHFHNHGKHGGGNRNRYATNLKKYKNQVERRKGKQFKEETSDDDTEIVPTHSPTYKKYGGWEY